MEVLKTFGVEVGYKWGTSESPQVTAKEVTFAAMEKIAFPGDLRVQIVEDIFDELYKVILKHVGDAIQSEKYN